LNVKQDTADKIRALQTYLGPGWLALWEDDGHLRFLAPELIQLYRDLSKPPDSRGIQT
jgi:hypothetical protein